MAEWSDDLVIELIYAVREHENLWDPHNGDKKNSRKRNDSWAKIAEKIADRSAEECKKKWKNLCQSYRQYRRKLKTKSGQGANEGHKVTWFAFDTMHSFMNDIYEPHGNSDAVS